ncbi:hypothetical protein JZO66_01745 [Enterococcus sp. DIV0242_7C1]|uniref:DUF5673 domain-containing protein n=1 Tax=Candidatus Enterococcus dunnyi TaxID=1834192 RepID=A0A200JE37_9ENTE|nr:MULTISPECIES: hypothetical protein [unclassified Enterococcus]MBO0469251.1 hypothetical protein [Enterococcus sp. DIV0242_7C1]OUZ35453.1 hypothetical protein A5889_000929 [Enterococcus sp. 9D6_DIV0238]
MIIDFFTVILFIFVVLLYVYLFLVRKSILIKSVKKKIIYVLISIVSLLILFLALSVEQTLDQRIRSFLAILLVLSFLLDAKGFSDDRLILGPFDRKGVEYHEIDKMALLLKEKEIWLNYFKDDRRGPVLKFSIPLEELLTFLSGRLNEDAEINILVDENQ